MLGSQWFLTDLLSLSLLLDGVQHPADNEVTHQPQMRISVPFNLFLRCNKVTSSSDKERTCKPQVELNARHHLNPECLSAFALLNAHTLYNRNLARNIALLVHDPRVLMYDADFSDAVGSCKPSSMGLIQHRSTPDCIIQLLHQEISNRLELTTVA